MYEFACSPAAGVGVASVPKCEASLFTKFYKKLFEFKNVKWRNG